MLEAVARDEPSPAAVNLEQRAESVIFELEEPIGITESGGSALQCERPHLRKWRFHGAGMA